jgi:serine protease Do
MPEGSKGVLVADVMSEGPARKAGVREGDVITEFNGRKVEGVRELQRSVAEAAIGRPVPLKVWREKGSKTLSINVGDMAEFDGAAEPGKLAKSKAKLGLGVRDLNPQEAEELKVDSGVMVEEVQPGSAAEEAGLMPGDAILELDRERLKSSSQFVAAAGKLKEGQAAILRVKRQGRSLYLTLHVPESK